MLHPETSQGLGSELLQAHTFKSKDLIGIWSRRGIVIAFKPSVEREVALLRRHFFRVVVLSRHFEDLATVRPMQLNEARISRAVRRSEFLIGKLAMMRYKLTLPENGLLSHFYEVTNLNEIASVLRDLNNGAARQVRQRRLDEQTRELNKSARTVAKVQAKLEWLELFFVAIYVTELGHIVAELLELKGWLPLMSIVAMGSGIASLFAWLLKPWRTEEE